MCPVFQLLDSNDLSKLAVLLACHLLTKCEADLLFLCESIPHLLHLFDFWLYLPDLVFYVIEQPAKRSLWALTFLNILGSLHSIFFLDHSPRPIMQFLSGDEPGQSVFDTVS